MFRFLTRKIVKKQSTSIFFRQIHQTNCAFYDFDPNHPFIKTLRVIKNDFIELKRIILQEEIDDVKHFTFVPPQVDILIIGGGAVGMAIAHTIKKRALNGVRIVVLERDSSLKQSSALFSAGELHQQFSNPETIEMALYGADYFRLIKENFRKDDDLHFEPYGFLRLADASESDGIIKDFELQEELGVRNQLMSATKLKESFPWLNVDGIEIGNYGVEKQGWFDHWSYIFGLKRAALSYGVEFINGEFLDFNFRHSDSVYIPGFVEKGSHFRPVSAKIKLRNGELKTIKFAFVIFACGHESAIISQKSKIGRVNHKMLLHELPIVPRKKFVYCVECECGPLIDMPLILDPSKVYIRRDGLGSNYIIGYSPEINEKVVNEKEYFYNKIYPIVKNRIPCMEKLQMRSVWSGAYAYNAYDGCGIIGPHPFFFNILFATGFSNLGIQMAPGIAQAFNEILIDGEYLTNNLTRFYFDRIIMERKLHEKSFF